MKPIVSISLLCLLLPITLGAGIDTGEASLYTIKRIERIAPVFAGVPVSGQFHEHNGYYFLAFYDPARQLTLAKAKAGTTDWEFAKLDEFVNYDGHNKAAFQFDREDHIHLSANMHGNPLRYWRSTRPMDITSLQPLNRMTGSNEMEVTYPYFFHGPDGELHFQYRSGHSGQGMQLINAYDEKTQTWQRKKMDDRAEGNAHDLSLLDGSPKSSAYPNGPTKGPDGLYHITWCWRDHFNGETNHDVGYARSKDLKIWTDSKGNRIMLPITPENFEKVANVPIMSGFMGGRLGFDSQNRVILTHLSFDRDGNSQVFAERLEKDGWKHYRITDWDKRWDMNGGGAFEFRISNEPVHLNAEGLLTMRIANELIFGDKTVYEYRLDETSLRPICAPIRIYPRALTEAPPADVPLRLNLQGPPEHMLRWFTRTTTHVENKAYAAKAPVNIWLEMVELEQTPNLVPGPYVPEVDRDETWNMMMDSLNLEQSPALAEADRLYKDGDFKAAYRMFRKHWQNRVKALMADPDCTPRWQDWPEKPSARLVTDTMKHRYEYAGLRRTLPYDVQCWWPFRPEVLEHWYGLNHTMNSSAPITAAELERISPLARWFNDLNRLKHLTILSTAYVTTRDAKTARYWAHDFYDWFYDNPMPKDVQETGPWAFAVTADRFCDAIMPALYQFAESEQIRDEEFFGLVRSINTHTRYLMGALNQTSASTFEREEAAEMLHWWASMFPEFKHSKQLAETAMGQMVTFFER